MPAVLTPLAVLVVLTVGAASVPPDAPPATRGLQLLPATLTAPDPAAAPERQRAVTPSTATSVPAPAAAAPAVATSSVSPPVRVQVPSIGVDSALVALGLQRDGSLEVPEGAFPAGWYTGGPTPGALGPAVLAGHVNWNGRRGVFAELHRVVVGDDVTVSRQDGTEAVFRVSKVQQISKGAFPTDAVYGNLDHAGLRLITCGGTFSEAARSYDDNVIVYADLVDLISA